MNTTSPTPAPNTTIDSGGLFLIGGLCFMIISFVMIIKCSGICIQRQLEPQIATPVVIEIPMAVSISTQTVDNEHIGSVV